MAGNVKKMKPIWFFVGLALVVMGGVILGTGLFDLVKGVGSGKVLDRLHPAVWWGGIMVAAGLIFALANRKASVE